MNTKLSILFYAKRAKTNIDGLIPIYLRVTVDGECIEVSTKRYTHPDKWSVEGNRMKGTTAETKAINTYLDTLKAKVYEKSEFLDLKVSNDIKVLKDKFGNGKQMALKKSIG